jgi:predicted transcriptional regulator
MAETEILTLRISRGLKRRLERLARASRRSTSYVAVEAIEHFLDLNEAQLADVRRAIKEANAGDFASDAEVRALFAKWSR